ncbi:unnamed protein product, partial [Mesorhabditis belari]|uniref:Phospholipid scramblase n=1 Tax=Mesorhabditis belari TaxID=2138241 RepID=A0AAF3JAU6_9BILA
MDNHAFTVQPGSLVPPPVPGSATQWMAPLPPIPNCPPGLEYLTLIDRIVVEEKKDLLDVVIGAGLQKYVVYYAYHERPDCEKMCSGDFPGLSTFMIDNFQRQVMRLFRPTECKLTCTAQIETFIEAPIGTRIGSVRHKSGFCNRDFWVTDAEGKSVLQILGPTDNWKCCAEYNDRVFKITTLEGAEIGEIRKKYMGYMMETYTDIDNFTVNFPMDLNVHTKATLIGATFIIDMFYYSNNQAGNRRN